MLNLYPGQKRLPLFDMLRGAALVSMLAYHFLYDVNVVGGADPGWAARPYIVLWQRLGAGLFILISGMCFMLGGARWRSGVKLLACGLLVTLATYIFLPQQLIICGVLTFMGAALLVTLALRLWLQKTPLVWGVLFCLAGYALTADIAAGEARLWGQTLWQWPRWLYQDAFLLLGFHGESFYSADYVPLLPHIFLYWLGLYLVSLLRVFAPGLALCGDWRWLTWPGRHSLLIYLAHQPLLLALAQLVRP